MRLLKNVLKNQLQKIEIDWAPVRQAQKLWLRCRLGVAHLTLQCYKPSPDVLRLNDMNPPDTPGLKIQVH